MSSPVNASFWLSEFLQSIRSRTDEPSTIHSLLLSTASQSVESCITLVMEVILPSLREEELDSTIQRGHMHTWELIAGLYDSTLPPGVEEEMHIVNYSLFVDWFGCDAKHVPVSLTSWLNHRLNGSTFQLTKKELYVWWSTTGSFEFRKRCALRSTVAGGSFLYLYDFQRRLSSAPSSDLHAVTLREFMVVLTSLHPTNVTFQKLAERAFLKRLQPSRKSLDWYEVVALLTRDMSDSFKKQMQYRPSQQSLVPSRGAASSTTPHTNTVHPEHEEAGGPDLFKRWAADEMAYCRLLLQSAAATHHRLRKHIHGDFTTIMFESFVNEHLQTVPTAETPTSFQLLRVLHTMRFVPALFLLERDWTLTLREFIASFLHAIEHRSAEIDPIAKRRTPASKATTPVTSPTKPITAEKKKHKPASKDVSTAGPSPSTSAAVNSNTPRTKTPLPLTASPSIDTSSNQSTSSSLFSSTPSVALPPRSLTPRSPSAFSFDLPSNHEPVPSVIAHTQIDELQRATLQLKVEVEKDKAFVGHTRKHSSVSDLTKFFEAGASSISSISSVASSPALDPDTYAAVSRARAGSLKIFQTVAASASGSSLSLVAPTSSIDSDSRLVASRAQADSWQILQSREDGSFTDHATRPTSDSVHSTTTYRRQTHHSVESSPAMAPLDSEAAFPCTPFDSLLPSMMDINGSFDSSTENRSLVDGRESVSSSDRSLTTPPPQLPLSPTAISNVHAARSIGSPVSSNAVTGRGLPPPSPRYPSTINSIDRSTTPLPDDGNRAASSTPSSNLPSSHSGRLATSNSSDIRRSEEQLEGTVTSMMTHTMSSGISGTSNATARRRTSTHDTYKFVPPTSAPGSRLHDPPKARPENAPLGPGEYDIPALSSRSTVWGTGGTRFPTKRLDQEPGPGSYVSPSTFAPLAPLPGRKNYTAGVLQPPKGASLLGTPRDIRNLPGPTLKGRIEDTNMKVTNLTPGPIYQLPSTFSPTPSAIVCSRIPPPRTSNEETPPPGSYEIPAMAQENAKAKRGVTMKGKYKQ